MPAGGTAGSRRPLAGLTDAEQIEPVSLHEKPGTAKALPGERIQEAPVRGFDRPAALADRVLVVVVRQPEVGDAPDVDLLDQARLAHPFQDAVGRDEAEGGRAPLRPPPDVLARREVAARGERFEDGDALRCDPQPGATKEGTEAIP